jgi:two-component system NtrC family sensor kinase
VTANVLIVEDSLTVRMNLADACVSAGFAACPCSNAGAARAAAAQGGIDAVVIDGTLPDTDANLLAADLRKMLGTAAPILILSSNAPRVEASDGVVTEYLGGSYDADQIVERTRALLEGAVNDRKTARHAPILIVDDSATQRAELERVLQARGFTTLMAASGEEALRLLTTLRPSVIVVDGVMPGMDGAAVIRSVRLDETLRGTPCILLTAAEGASAELGALDAGADAFVRKDGDLQLLVLKVQALLRNRESTQTFAEGSPSPKRVLAVDDSRTYREELSRVLQDAGYEVLSCSSGEDALALLATEVVDCVLLDLLMPGIGGRETCRQLKESSGTRDIPVVVLTAVEDREAMLDGLAVGADDFIQKNSEFEVLLARVRAQIRRRQFEAETRRVRERLLRNELETARARSAQQLAETRASLVDELERRNDELHHLAEKQAALAEQFRIANDELARAYSELQATQSQLVQSAKMASLGELVAGAAHEINNPLAFVLSHLQTVDRCLVKLRNVDETTAEPLWTRATDRLREMASGLTRIRDLVVKLRTFSRLDEGEYGTVDVAECVESLLTILQHRIKHIHIVKDLAGPTRIECYPGLLNQALMNLVSNAIDACSEGGTISLVSRDAGGVCELSVKDDGTGIPNDLKPRVTEPFFTTKPVGQGTGLGLSITYSIVRKHRGELVFRDALPQGTEAVIRIPLNPRMSAPEG